MKKVIFSLFLGVCVLLCAACAKDPASSAPAESDSAGQSRVETGSVSSAPSSSSPASQSAASSSSGPDTVDTEGWIQQFVSLPVTGQSKKTLLVLKTPPEWESDNYQTFSADGVKIAEVPAVYAIGDAAFPFSEEITEGYAHSEIEYPAGYGLQRTQERVLAGRSVRTYLYKTWPDDSDRAWYPHYTLAVVDGYVVAIHYYSFDESADDAVFDAITSSLELHFREDASGASPAPDSTVSG